MAMPPALGPPTLTVEPSSLSFPVTLDTQAAETLYVTNPHDRDVCFKVKTTAPRRYCVRPNAARIPPQQTVKVEVLAQAMDRYPAEDNCKDKFLVQMAWLPDKDMDVIEYWKDLSALAEQRPKENKPFAEKKLKSVLVVPGYSAATSVSARASPQAETAAAGANESYQSVQRAAPAGAVGSTRSGARGQPGLSAVAQKVAAPTASSAEVDRLRAQLSQAQAALAKGGGAAGVKKVELMYAVMATLLAFIFGYFL